MIFESGQSKRRGRRAAAVRTSSLSKGELFETRKQLKKRHKKHLYEKNAGKMSNKNENSDRNINEEYGTLGFNKSDS